MDDHHGDIAPHNGGEWVGLGEAARRLGVTRAAIYGRIQRKTLVARPKGNRGLEVLWPPPQHRPDSQDDVIGDGQGDVTVTLLADLRERLSRAEAETVELREQVASLRVDLGKASERVEAARAVAIADVATARAEVEAARDAAEGRIAAAGVEVAAIRELADRLTAELIEARRSWWRRMFGN